MKQICTKIAHRGVAVIAIAGAILGGGAVAHAEIIYGVTDPGSSGTTSSLVSFDSSTPGTVTTIGILTGLVAGQAIRGIDFRPSTGQLYAISNSTSLATGAMQAAQLYTVNLGTGSLTTVGGALTLTGTKTRNIYLDVDPVADVMRVTTLNNQNYRVNLNTGALIAQDTAITPSNDFYSGIAYSNNVVGAASTTLYAYNYAADTIGTIGSVGGTPNSPNGGVYTPLGDSGISTQSAVIGFDISGATGTAYLSARGTSSVNPQIFTLNIATGGATLIGSSTVALEDISVQTVSAPEPATATMAALASIGLCVGRRRRRTH